MSVCVCVAFVWRCSEFWNPKNELFTMAISENAIKSDDAPKISVAHYPLVKSLLALIKHKFPIFRHISKAIKKASLVLFDWNPTAISTITPKKETGNKKQFATLRRFIEPLRIELVAVLGIHATVMNNFPSKLFANPSLVLVCMCLLFRVVAFLPFEFCDILLDYGSVKCKYWRSVEARERI